MNIKTVSKLATTLLAALFIQTSAYADGHGHSDGDVLKDIPSGTYNVDLTHASVVWKVSHFGLSTYVGRFNDFTADIELDSSEFSKSSVAVDIKTDSLDTDYPFPEKEDFNKKLSEKWLSSGDAPSITFKSTSVSDLDGKSFTIAGELSMAGQTHPVTLNAKINGAMPSHPFLKKPVIGFSASTTLDRTVWGVSKYAPNIGADVRVEIEGEFIKAE